VIIISYLKLNFSSKMKSVMLLIDKLEKSIADKVRCADIISSI
jgi:hypothetical protein